MIDNIRIWGVMIALRRLANAAEVYAADQSGATDARVGLVQPISVAEANELNAALRDARDLISSFEEWTQG